MRINLIAVGKKMPGWVTMGFNDYVKRLTSDIRLHLIEIKTSACPREGEQMLAAIPKNNTIIALDIHGKLWNTLEFASQLRVWRDKGQDISLLVGGPDGLAPSCLERANFKWSLSRLTFPHTLVRVIIAEQLYRAFSILIHHPYHRS